jgi:hypothetical protein
MGDGKAYLRIARAFQVSKECYHCLNWAIVASYLSKSPDSCGLAVLSAVHKFYPETFEKFDIPAGKMALVELRGTQDETEFITQEAKASGFNMAINPAIVRIAETAVAAAGRYGVPLAAPVHLLWSVADIYPNIRAQLADVGLTTAQLDNMCRRYQSPSEITQS